MTTTPRHRVVLGLATLLAAGAVAVSAQAATSSTPASALVMNQAIKDSAISVEYLYLPERGYVAVYQSNAEGKPTGTPIGSIGLDAGDHRDIKVSLSAQPKSGEKLWVSLYRDADDDPSFDPGSGDEPFWAKDGHSAESAFQVQ